jgi:hypothetical protein
MDSETVHHDANDESSAPRPMTVYGRQGSPTITLALPFSRVDVRADDAAPLVAELAALTARLARAIATLSGAASQQPDLAAIADAADALSSTGRRDSR